MSRRAQRPRRSKTRADAAALVWAPDALDKLAQAAELTNVHMLEMVSMWLTFIEEHPEAKG